MYMRKEGLTARALAKRLDIDESHASLLLSGRRLPSLPLADKIARLAHDRLPPILETLLQDRLSLD